MIDCQVKCNTNPNVMVSVGSVDFTGREEMFNALKRDITNKKPKLLDYLIFDEDDHTVWLIWSDLYESMHNIKQINTT